MTALWADGPRRLGAVPAALVAAGLLTVSPAVQVAQGEEAPAPSGLIETSGISLILLDVEVQDKQGRPMPGLTKRDFTVRLDLFEREIYSVDDFCPAAPESAGPPEGSAERTALAAGAGEAGAVTAPPDGSAPVEADLQAGGKRQLPLVVFFFDFLLLQPDGRAHAVSAAKDWVGKSMAPGQMATVIASTPAGPKELCPETANREKILAALGKAATDPAFADSFPSLLGVRMRECGGCVCPFRPSPEAPLCCAVCPGYLQEEYHQGRNSLKALRQVLSDLERIEGPKALLLFHENGVIDAQNLYPGIPPTADVDDHLPLMESAGAEATTARAKVYPVYSGAIAGTEGLGVNYGANLANFTGGRYNRTVNELPSFLAEAGRGPACVYRLGIIPPDHERERPYQALVEVRGRALEARYRVQHLDERDRWLRSALAVLRHPEEARELPLGAALIPHPADRGKWDISVQVAVDPASLAATRATQGVQENWEVGAILTRDNGRADWQMLGLSSMIRGGQATPVPVLHERVIPGAKSGVWKLAAFVRDRTAGAFGGGQAVLTLPGEGEDALVGPVSLRLPRMRFVSDLPFLRADKSPAATTGHPSAGPLPAGEGPAPPEGLEMWTWICPAVPGSPAGRLRRYVSKDDHPEFRVSGTDPVPDGRCFVVKDRLESEALSPGIYAYHMEWQRPGKETLDAVTEFEVVGRSQRSEGDATNGAAEAPGSGEGEGDASLEEAPTPGEGEAANGGSETPGGGDGDGRAGPEEAAAPDEAPPAGPVERH